LTFESEIRHGRRTGSITHQQNTINNFKASAFHESSYSYLYSYPALFFVFPICVHPVPSAVKTQELGSIREINGQFHSQKSTSNLFFALYLPAPAEG